MAAAELRPSSAAPGPGRGTRGAALGGPQEPACHGAQPEQPPPEGLLDAVGCHPVTLAFAHHPALERLYHQVGQPPPAGEAAAAAAHRSSTATPDPTPPFPPAPPLAPQHRLAECHAWLDYKTIFIHGAVIAGMVLLVGLRRRLQWSNVVHAVIISLDAAAILRLRRSHARYAALRDWVTGATRVACHLVGALGLAVWFTTTALWVRSQQAAGLPPGGSGGGGCEAPGGQQLAAGQLLLLGPPLAAPVGGGPSELAQEGWAGFWYRLLLGAGVVTLNFLPHATPLAFKHALPLHVAMWALHALVGPGQRAGRVGV
jgi:hypothetical protein